MNQTLKNKWLLIAVVLLMIMNVVTLAVWWSGRIHDKRPAQTQGVAADFIIQQLGFDKTQEQAYRQMIDEHRKGSAIIRGQIKEAKDKLFDLLQQPAVNDSIKNAAIAAANEEAEKLDQLTFEHFRKVRELCNADQQKKFDAIIHEALSLMAPRPPAPPPPPPGADPAEPPSPPIKD